MRKRRKKRRGDFDVNLESDLFQVKSTIKSKKHNLKKYLLKLYYPCTLLIKKLNTTPVTILIGLLKSYAG